MSFFEYSSRFSLFLIFIFTIFANERSVNAGNNVFEVRGVQVDVTSDTAAKAQKKALADGEMKAFNFLLRRLTLTIDRNRLPKFDTDQVADYVRDFEVIEEKISTVRYLARLNFRFKVQPTRDLLVDLNIPFSESISEPVLVLPVYQNSKYKLFWDDTNLLRDVWESHDGSSGLVPLIHPHGGLRDIGIIDAEHALKGDIRRLQNLGEIYQTSTIAVVHGILSNQLSKNGKILEIFMAIYSGSDQLLASPIKIFQNEGESEKDLLRRAVNLVIDIIDDGWKEKNIIDLNEANVASITVPITNLNDWLTIQKRLQTVFLITRIEPVLLSLDEVRVNIHYVGRIKQLHSALAQAELSLITEESELVLYPSSERPRDSY